MGHEGEAQRRPNLGVVKAGTIAEPKKENQRHGCTYRSEDD